MDEVSFGWSDLCEVEKHIRCGGRCDGWNYDDQLEEEAGAVKTVLTAARHQVVDLRSRQREDGPPDCEATIDGQQCAVEHTELVDQPTLEASIKGVEQHRVWTREDLCQELQIQIDAKDRKKIKGGPYEKYILVIVTAELYLYRENVAQFLEGATFQAQQFADVYLGLSYHPELGGGSYPVFKLVLVPRKHEA